MASDKEAAYSRDYARRNYHAITPRSPLQSVTIPEDVERLEEHRPCFNCGTRGACRHRPWLQDLT